MLRCDDAQWRADDAQCRTNNFPWLPETTSWLVTDVGDVDDGEVVGSCW